MELASPWKSWSSPSPSWAATVLLAPRASVLPYVSRRAVLQSLGASSVVLLPVVAAILAPRAAQAYGGCFDCSNTIVSPARSNSSSTPPAESLSPNSLKF